MDSDSDDDDLLLASPGLSRREKKVVDQAQEKQRSLLEDALTDSKSFCDSTARVTTLKKENIARDDEEMKAEIQEFSERMSKTRLDDEDDRDEMEAGDISKQDPTLDRQRRIDLAQAASTCLTWDWGMRPIVNFQPDKCPNVSFYSSEEEATEALYYILNNHTDKENHERPPPLTKVLLACIEKNLLNDFFHNDYSMTRLLKACNSTQLETDMFEWLKTTTRSAGGFIKSQFFREGIQNNLEAIVLKDCCPKHVKKIAMDQFAEDLGVWVDLSFSNETNNGMEVDSEEQDYSSDDDFAGLLNILRYWNLLLGKYKEASNFAAKVATNCLVSLCLLSLDDLNMSNRSVRGMQTLLGQIIPVFLDFVQAQMKDTTDEWMDEVVDFLQVKFKQLGPGQVGTDDGADKTARICHSALLRFFPRHTVEGSKDKEAHNLANHFRVKLATKSLNVLSDGKVSEFESHVHKHEEFSAVCNNAFSNAIGALKFLHSIGENIIDDAALCPAIIECATESVISALVLVKLEQTNNWEYSKSQARAVASVLEQLEDGAFRLKKVLSGMATNPHIRRALNHLNTMSQYYRECLIQARTRAGENNSAEQTNLKFFFKTHQEKEHEDE